MNKILYFANKNLEYLFKKNNYNSYTQFAKDLKIDRTYPEKIINGKQLPSINVLIQIRNFFNINLDDLIFKNLEIEEIKKWKPNAEF